MSSHQFTGFTPQTLEFFKNLDLHNNRKWFQKHRNEYVEHVFNPMKQLAVALTPIITDIDPQAVTAPIRSVSRINRDTRFSNDKSPYRPRMWLAFKHNTNYWTEQPTYFFQVEADSYVFGMGMYAANAATMRKFREQIDDDPDRFLKIITPINKSRTMNHDAVTYKRKIPSKHPKQIDNWYQCKSVAVITERKPDKILFTENLVNKLEDNFVKLKPLFDYIWRATVIR